ncbi:MAG: hypothetical protein UX30_C0005G0025 [Candidatus Saccharibacteria bacterium GW2011_GWA2_46_10]|nr:MAG: hypothetical protein UX30_C0005G0025 [Candidatus Saccharibacteria bacterium GW2011_GWA2_46_10]
MKLMFYIFLAISLIFIASLVLKNVIKKPLCALCVAIASVWLILLYLYKSGNFSNQILLALLIGQSITGIYYLAYRKLPKTLRIFSLPFFLTLTALAYALIAGDVELTVFGLLAVLWLMAWGIFAYRHDPGKTTIGKVLAKCCEDL